MCGEKYLIFLSLIIRTSSLQATETYWRSLFPSLVQHKIRIPLNLPVLSYFWFWFKKQNLPIEISDFQTFKSLASSSEENPKGKLVPCPLLSLTYPGNCGIFYQWMISRLFVQEIFPVFLFKLRTKHTSTLISHILVFASAEPCLLWSDYARVRDLP